jgi:hypothetical protein
MHNAPPVAFPVGRFVWGRALWLSASLLGASGLIVWQQTSGASGAGVLLPWAFWAVCVAGAAVWCPRQHLSQGRLFWSGEDWFWMPDRAAGQGEIQSVSLSVGLDLGFGLLLWLRLTPEGATKPGPLRSAWLEKQSMPSKWHGFRCAVYSRQMAADSAKSRRHEQI